ncbi:MAG TPA: response regulator transcription factor [Anaerolineales bacterium]|nr:response regulator transcription factor [Anaerolineales bacterium]
MSKPITVFLVDDHAVVRQGIRASLEARQDFLVVGEAESGEEALRHIPDVIPDVVVMDLMMEGMDGVEATRKIKHLSPHTQVVVLTSYHDDEHIFPALQAGAISYQLKSVKIEELAESIRRAANREATLHPRVAARMIKEVQNSKSGTTPFSDLTNREMEILKLIANGLTNSEIMAKLVLSENTVKGHVSNILSKLHLADRTQVAVLAWRTGIMKDQ